jgi:hypothetical protein
MTRSPSMRLYLLMFPPPPVVPQIRDQIINTWTFVGAF